MRKIILASGSKARQRLLRQIGLRFRIEKSNVREEHLLTGSCRSLVMRNAVKKAADIAGKNGSGVVIAADTVVLVGNRIIGKPKNMKDAMRTLKTLSRKPQWVYTGIAVVDIDKGRTYTDFDKTKVYIYRLDDRQIRSYFRKISPFDKAGSFDVQGPGSIFIDRIEGCFYNVVGLPLAKLAKLLKKTGVEIF
ncbi:MAG: nucleoside triphosphate pyrophosphatase [Candidatus Omnitrophota bacterium]